MTKQEQAQAALGDWYSVVNGGMKESVFLDKHEMTIGSALEAMAAPNKGALEALEKARTLICVEAAACVRSDDLPSDIQEDYKRKVPVWLLRSFTALHEKQRQRGIRLKQAYDILGTVRKALGGESE